MVGQYCRIIAGGPSLRAIYGAAQVQFNTIATLGGDVPVPVVPFLRPDVLMS